MAVLVVAALVACGESGDESGGDTGDTVASGGPAPTTGQGQDGDSDGDGSMDGSSGVASGEGTADGDGTSDGGRGATTGIACEFFDFGARGCPDGTVECNEVGPAVNCSPIETADVCCQPPCEGDPDCQGG